ncbi:Type IV pilus secretin PilQ [Kangiella sediminilitoris]|uniref:Type IV pilus secretin PilQ n=2 Tax=Kangiella sediminilitoris TaxID=1144748 RepID=A0A1B3B8G6_9GAMM|nr:Type IV pilus secretin PilQ [Kangiella sediminilitoris]
MRIKNEERMNKSKLGKTTMLIKMKKLIKNCSVLAGAMLFSWGVHASTLQSIDYNVLPGDKVMVRLSYSDMPPTPQEFTTNSPARISMDFAGVDSGLDYKTKDIGVGAVGSVTAIEAGDRTRVVINLSELVSFNSEIQGNAYVVTLDAGSGAGSAAASKPGTSSSYTASSEFDITGVDFRRGTAGEGRVLVTLGSPNVNVDLRQEGRTVIADFIGSDIDPDFIRRLDVIDFGTPAQLVETSRRGDTVRLSVRGNDRFDYLAYQADDLYTIELKPLSKQEIERREREKPKYTGERLTLQFQDMDLKAILHTLGDFAGINIVISDDVQGSMALNLVNVPWDQALDIILKSKGLDKRKEGNVMMVAPADVIAAREQQELEANKQQEELAPLRTELIQVNYAKASEVAALLATAGGEGDSSKVGVLSERGAVSVDARTNTLIVRDVSSKLEDVRRLITQLDIPVEQVLIEARIVTASDGFVRDLGARFGVSDTFNSQEAATSGSLTDTNFRLGLLDGQATLDDRMNVNLPVSNAAGSLGLTFARLADGIIVDLELSALEAENRGEVVASPKVITANQKEAFIKAGEEIPYQQSAGGAAAGGGATTIQFKEAVLELKVTPQITPDGRVILDLAITQDTRGEELVFDGVSGGAPAINTQEIGTQVLVDNGETIVLGGIFQHRTKYDETKVPLLGDIPLLGWLFRNTSRENSKEELLIFVTPKILKQGLKN